MGRYKHTKGVEIGNVEKPDEPWCLRLPETDGGLEDDEIISTTRTRRWRRRRNMIMMTSMRRRRRRRRRNWKTKR